MFGMRRREFISLLGGGAAAWPLAAHAQRVDRVRQVGVLMTSADDSDGRHRLIAFQEGLENLGWRDGANLRIDIRWGAADMNRIRAHAKELSRLKPDVILATSGRVVNALQGEARDVPIVFVGPTDPVGTGFVKSMSRPGGNITRGIEVVAAPVHTRGEIEMAIDAFARGPDRGLILLQDVTIADQAELIATLAGRHRLPAISGHSAFPARGGLSESPRYVPASRIIR
jgi:putative tryptophan/tyrosine transport system substrate-binding protein